MMPSLSVDQADPSRHRNDAPADSSPPKATDPSSSPGTNHLKPTGTDEAPAELGRHLVDEDDETSVLPIPAETGQSGRCESR